QMMEDLVAFDTDKGQILWRDKSIRVGGGYRVGSHKALKLSNGRRILVTTAGKALDVETGQVVADFGLMAYGAEGAGASIVGEGNIAYIVGAPSKRSPVMAAIRFTPEGDDVTAETLWMQRFPTTGYSPVLHDGHVYRFTERAKGDTFRGSDGKLTKGAAIPREALGNFSPILAGEYFFSMDSQGSRQRVDDKNIVAAHVLRLNEPVKAELVSDDNLLEGTAPPPDLRLEQYAPEAYELNCWGMCGGIPSHFANSSPYAHGNRVLIRTLNELICIGDPDQPYDVRTQSGP
ncbi:MAG: hypothetical protein ACOC93_05585, partial [Planctomycetota bacterium]